MDKNILINIRKEYIEKLKRELLGPGSEFITTDIEHEVISAPANARYSIGVLHPCGEQFNADNDENQTEGNENEEVEDAEQDENSDVADVSDDVASSGVGANNAIFILDRKSTRLNSSHCRISRMPSSA